MLLQSRKFSFNYYYFYNEYPNVPHFLLSLFLFDAVTFITMVAISLRECRTTKDFVSALSILKILQLFFQKVRSRKTIAMIMCQVVTSNNFLNLDAFTKVFDPFKALEFQTIYFSWSALDYVVFECAHCINLRCQIGLIKSFFFYVCVFNM